MTTANTIRAEVNSSGLSLSGRVFCEKLSLDAYLDTLGNPDRTIEAGPPAPVGHRNNRVHVFDRIGIYLTEHHASRLIESVNFVFDVSESPFSIKQSFSGDLQLFAQEMCLDMTEDKISGFTRDLQGEYSIKSEGCWVGVSAVGRKGPGGKRIKPRYIVHVSVCF